MGEAMLHGDILSILSAAQVEILQQRRLVPYRYAVSDDLRSVRFFCPDERIMASLQERFGHDGQG